MTPSPTALSGLLTLLAMPCLPAAQAAGYEVIATFERPGTQPLGPLALGPDGNFYGTTVAGGARDEGSLFRLNPAGIRTQLVSLGGTGGAAPEAGLVRGPDGAWWGSATSGGAGGFGAVFRLTDAGIYSVVVSFTGTAGTARGSAPQGLISHPDGNFYGLTLAGGAAGAGTVFRLTPAGVLTTLVDFTGNSGAAKGAEPIGRPAVSGTNLYGATRSGGSAGLGTLFRVTTGGTFTLLTEFTGISGARPGSNPAAGLFLNNDGALYGTCELGGLNDLGTVFKITDVAAPVFTTLRHCDDPTGSQPSGALVRGGDAALYGVCATGGATGNGAIFRQTTTGAASVLTHFSGVSGATPGAAPRAGLVPAGDGSLWGTTSAGGPGQAGTFFKVTTTGAFTSLGSFTAPSGYGPAGAPVLDNNGSLLFPMAAGGTGGGGTLLGWNPVDGAITTLATFGGLTGSNPAGSLLHTGNDFLGLTASGGSLNRGTAFRFNATSGLSTLASFNAGAGSLSEGPLVLGADGAFYGVSREGGTAGHGTLFRLSPTGVRTRLVSFTGLGGAAAGSSPRGPLVQTANGNFYGVTSTGGTADAGTLFRMTPAGVLTTLAHFTATGPRQPESGLTPGPGGYLYGTTRLGGADNAGTVLRLDPATGAWQIMASFTNAATGSPPLGPLVAAPDGSFYGITTSGGPGTYGTLFHFNPGSSSLIAAVDFTGPEGVAPGSGSGAPAATGGLLVRADGTVFGVAPGGGPDGGGVAFRYAPFTPLMAWKVAFLGDPAAPDLGDPDQDGIPTLMEYALGLHPGIPDTPLMPDPGLTLAAAGPVLSLTVPRDPAHPDINLSVEAATDLSGPWQNIASSTTGSPFTGPGYTSGDSTSAGVKSVLIQDPDRTGAFSHRFLRFRVTR